MPLFYCGADPLKMNDYVTCSEFLYYKKDNNRDARQKMLVTQSVDCYLKNNDLVLFSRRRIYLKMSEWTMIYLKRTRNIMNEP